MTSSCGYGWGVKNSDVIFVNVVSRIWPLKIKVYIYTTANSSINIVLFIINYSKKLLETSRSLLMLKKMYSVFMQILLQHVQRPTIHPCTKLKETSEAGVQRMSKLITVNAQHTQECTTDAKVPHNRQKTNSIQNN